MNAFREEELFSAAIATPAEEREAFLAAACKDDDALRARVESLLAEHERPDSLLDTSPGADARVTANLKEVAGTSIGPYKLLQEIGEGGMGVVFLAEQTEPIRRKVALKIIKPGMDSRLVTARFEAERQALSLMEHPNIAKVLDAGASSSGRPYFVMELVKGSPITKYCDEHQLTTRERLELLLPVCHAVQHAHQKGIIHRDLKPSNILVATYDGRPVPKVIDFGVAKATGGQLTEKTLFTGMGQILGTLEYMSPEQARFDQLDVDTRSDIYSLGVVLYELLTGATPFDRQRLKSAALEELLRIIREEEPPRPSTRISTLESLPSLAANRKIEPRRLSSLLRGELDWIVMKALEKERTRRYPTAGGLADDLQRYLNEEPVHACPPSTTYRLRKFVRRRKGLAIVAVATLLALVGGAAGAGWGMIQARGALKVAEGEATARKAALERAREAEADEAAFSFFLVRRVLAAARPAGVQGGQGIEVSVVQALESAEQHIDEDLGGRPRAEASARDAIGVTWRNWGRYDKAERHLRRAVELRERHLGKSELFTLNSRNSLAAALQQAGRSEEAVAMLEETVSRAKEALGPKHPQTLIFSMNLAYSYAEVGRLDDAFALGPPTLEATKRQLGEDNVDTFNAMEIMAGCFALARRHDESQLLLTQLVEKQERTLGSSHSLTLMSKRQLAHARRQRGDYAQAAALFEAILPPVRETFGAGHPETIATLSDLGDCYETMGDLDRGLPMIEQAHQAATAGLGPEHPDTLELTNNLAVTYLRLGRAKDAQPLLEELVRRWKAALGADHPSTLTAEGNLAGAYSENGRLAEAAAILEPLLARYVRLDARHPQSLTTRMNLASLLGELGNDEQADKLSEEALSLARETRPPGDPVLAGAMSIRARVLMDRKAFNDADALLRQSLAIRELTQPEHYLRFHTMSLLGECLLSLGRTDEAERLLVEAFAGLKARETLLSRGARKRLQETALALARHYDAQGNSADADQWRQRAQAPGDQ